MQGWGWFSLASYSSTFQRSPLFLPFFIPLHPNDLIFPLNLELFYPLHPSVTSFPSVTYSGLDRSVIPCYHFEWFLAASPADRARSKRSLPSLSPTCLFIFSHFQQSNSV